MTPTKQHKGGKRKRLPLVNTNIWMITLGDLLTLLLTFFVLRISMSTNTINAPENNLLTESKANLELVDKLISTLKNSPVQLTILDNKIIIKLPSSSFTPNSNDLTFNAMDQINLISKITSQAKTQIEIISYNLNQLGKLDSWDLSTSQALTISRQLIDTGVDPQSISIMGYTQINTDIENKSGFEIIIYPTI